jgi:hypothetical protein
MVDVSSFYWCGLLLLPNKLLLVVIVFPCCRFLYCTFVVAAVNCCYYLLMIVLLLLIAAVKCPRSVCSILFDAVSICYCTVAFYCRLLITSFVMNCCSLLFFSWLLVIF